MARGCRRTWRHIRKLLQQPGRIPLARVRGWMQSPDLAVQAAVLELLRLHDERVEAPGREEGDRFYLGYLEGCLREDRRHSAVLCRYLAGAEACGWFLQLWREQRGQRDQRTALGRLAAIRGMLERLCRQGDPALSDAVATAILEHLFRDPEIVRFFRYWERDPALSSAFAEAMRLASLPLSDELD